MRRLLLLPVLGLALAGCGGNGNEISGEERDQFVSGCTRTAPKNVSCACVFDELKKAGYDTEDEFECPYGWWKWAALLVAVDMINKEEGDPAPRLADFAREDARIRGLLAKRDKGRAPRIATVPDNRVGWWAGPFGYRNRSRLARAAACRVVRPTFRRPTGRRGSSPRRASPSAC